MMQCLCDIKTQPFPRNIFLSPERNYFFFEAKYAKIEARNAEIPELRKKFAELEMPNLRMRI
jgi:hypothetical protein